MTIRTIIAPPSISKKGAPPTMQNASNNLVQKLEDDLVAFNFRVPAKFRKQVKQYALDNDTTAVDVMIDALTEYINK